MEKPKRRNDGSKMNSKIKFFKTKYVFDQQKLFSFWFFENVYGLLVEACVHHFHQFFIFSTNALQKL